MIQPGEFLTNMLNITSGLESFVKFPFKVLQSYSKNLGNINTIKYKNNKNNLFIDAGLNIIGKKIKEKFVLRITLTNNETKDLMKVIKSLENRPILIKRVITSQEKEFLNFLRPLMTAGLPVMKSVLPL